MSAGFDFDEERWPPGWDAHAPSIEDPPAEVINFADRRAGKQRSAPASGGPDRTGLGATPFQAGAGYARRFPHERLPERMRQYVEDLAVRKQVPVDLPALTLLGMIGAAAGPRLVVRRDTDWAQPCNIYTCCALLSGAGKSPVVDEIRNGAEEAQKLLDQRHRADLTQRIRELKQRGEELHLQANLAHPPRTDELRAEARSAEAEAEALEKDPPPTPDFILDGDTTIEALNDSLADNGGGGAIVDDEGTFFRILGGLYAGGRSSNLGLVLVGYDCRYYKAKRVGRPSKPIGRAALSLVISPQPNIVADVMRDQMMDASGFINRFIVCVPGDLTGMRAQRPSTYYRHAAGPKSGQIGQAWWAGLLSSLIGYRQLDSGDVPETAIIDLTEEAYKLHREYEVQIERRLHPTDGDLTPIRQWASKHVARVLRIAALLHLAAGESPSTEISEEVMESAIIIGEWTIEHFVAAGPAAGLSTDAGRIKEYVDGTEAGYCSRSALFKRVFNGHASADKINTWVTELVATGEYELREQKTTGRKRLLIGKTGFVIQAGGEDGVA